MIEIRFDRSQEIPEVKKTIEGYLEIVAPVAKVGVYKYRRKDGSIQREFIPHSTLFSEKSISSLKLKPVTKTHPKNFVSRKDYKRLSVGSVGETLTESDGMLYAKFIVSDEDAIVNIENGSIRQLSPSYKCEVIEEHGFTDDGEEYDCIQVDRVYNHLALVPKARGGDDLSIRMDGCDSIELNTDNNNKKELRMPSIRIDGIDHTIEDPAVVTHIADLNAKVLKMDSLEQSLSEKDSQLITLQGKFDALDAELKSKPDAEEVIAKRVDAKINLIAKAEKVLGAGCVKADQADLEIMKAVITKVSPTAKFDGYEGEHQKIYVEARFDACMESFTPKSPIANQRISTTPIHNDADTDNRSSAQKRNDNLESSWESK